MKNRIFIFLLFFTLSMGAQQQTANFKDGTSIDYDVISNDIKTMKHHSIMITPMGLDELNYNFITYNYYNPKYFLVNINLAILYSGFDAQYFLFSSERKKKTKAILRSELSETKANTIVNYTASIDYIRHYHFGPHFGYAIGLDWYNQGYLGIGLTTTKHFKIANASDGKTISKTNMFGLFVDFIYTPSTDAAVLDLYGIPNHYGAKIYIQAKSSLSVKKDIGIYYKLGLAYITAGTIMPVICLGPYFSF